MDKLQQQLHHYCDGILGFPTEDVERPPKLKKRKNCQDNGKLQTIENCDRILDNKVPVLRPKKTKRKHKTSTSDIKISPNCTVTDDGFKIVREIPDDDMDVSDAFDNDSDDDRSSKEGGVSKYTDDGFKIVSSISSDESGVSDAFESDIDEEDCAERLRKSSKESIDDFRQMDSKDRAVSSLIKVFRLEPLLSETPSNKSAKCTSIPGVTTFASRLKCPSEVKIIDHSVKRQTKKTKNTKKDGNLKSSESDDKEYKKFMKRARYDVMRAGTSRLGKLDKKAAMIALAVKLGAKSQKKQAVNYKVLQQQRKEDIQKKQEERETKRRMGLTLKMPNPVGKKKASSKSQPRFKDGILNIKKREIKRINSSR